MNIQEKRSLAWRIVSSVLLLCSMALSIFNFVKVITMDYADIALILISLGIAAVFALFQIVIILKGGKKESNLQKIVFNQNGSVNTLPIFAVGIGTVLGLGITSLGTAVYFIKEEVFTKMAMLVVLSIGTYLLVNCIIYFIYLIMFKKREFNIYDLIK